MAYTREVRQRWCVFIFLIKHLFTSNVLLGIVIILCKWKNSVMAVIWHEWLVQWSSKSSWSKEINGKIVFIILNDQMTRIISTN